MTVQNYKRGRGRPRLEPNKDSREEILSSAIIQFGQRGFTGVSLSQIANEAGSDIALIRYYFGSKESLWKKCIDRLATILGSEVSRVIDKEFDSETEKLKAVIRWFVDMSARWPQVSRIIVFEGDNLESRGQYVIDHLVTPFYVGLTSLIQAVKQEGNIVDVSPRTLFFMITHGGSFPMALPVLTNAFPGGDIAKKSSLTDHADSIIKLLFQDEQIDD